MLSIIFYSKWNQSLSFYSQTEKYFFFSLNCLLYTLCQFIFLKLYCSCLYLIAYTLHNIHSKNQPIDRVFVILFEFSCCNKCQWFIIYNLIREHWNYCLSFPPQIRSILCLNLWFSCSVTFQQQFINSSTLLMLIYLFVFYRYIYMLL